MKQPAHGRAVRSRDAAPPAGGALDSATFRRQLVRAAPAAAGDEALLAALEAHYRELLRWSATVDLIGPGAAEELIERHYAESLAGLELLPPRAQRLVDLGSGAGFPGFVLAAARRDLEVYLVEPRQRRRAFLAAATRAAALSCHCLDARVSASAPSELPGDIDVVTLRALRLERPALERLLTQLAPDARLLVWRGRRGLEELPAGLVPGRVLPLAGSEHRVIREYVRVEAR